MAVEMFLFEEGKRRCSQLPMAATSMNRPRLNEKGTKWKQDINACADACVSPEK